MKKHENKVLHFLSALQDVYRDPEERESEDISALELSSDEITDDFFAIIQAFYIFYQRVTGDNSTDLLGFSHLINRLVYQFTNLDENDESKS